MEIWAVCIITVGFLGFFTACYIALRIVKIFGGFVKVENIMLVLMASLVFFIPAMALKAVIDDIRMDKKK